MPNQVRVIHTEKQQFVISILFLSLVTEEAYLKQLAIEEWYGKKQAEKAKTEKEEM